MKIKKSKSLILLCLIILISSFAYTGCTKKEPITSGEVMEVPQILTIARVGDVGSMNPHLYDSDMGAQTLVYEPLVNLDQQGNIIPWLAVSWEIENDGRSLVFQLREDVKFSDGEAFNAEVVKQNFDAVLSNATRHNWLPLIDNLETVEVVAPYTVALHMKEAYPFSLLELTMVRPIRFLSPGGFGADGIAFDKPLGTGAYILAEYVQDERAVFVRNENYWGEKPNLEKIVIRPVPDSNVRLNALMAGEVDLIIGSGVTAVSYMDFKSLENNPNVEGKIAMGDVAQFLALNPSTELLKDKSVRQAIALAIDPEEINLVAYEGMESLSETMFSTKIPEVLGKAKRSKRNLEKAKELLVEAGWTDLNGDGYVEKNGENLEILYNIRSDVTTQRTVAEVVQAQLAEIGIKVNISPVESTVYFDRRSTGDFGIMPDVSWGIQYDPQSIYKSLRDARPYFAPAFQGEAAALFQQALKTLDDNQRREKFDRIADIFMNEEFVIIPMTITPNIAVYNKSVEGFEFSANVWELGKGLTNVRIVE
ncbi:nickel ABC transporter, nickel/metallophore periplasmic binding protein [Clostridium aceticum]|uniref:Nickel ABC transporter, nickel/metallophore periplasmic binding protein n=1 Tax=Clostridium aceticum TaxID=84022 RepID=A0A0D8I9I6_9CLOT|nr:nickel ABC transporter substrate-binding protein [Clostridium aceticum]AKL96323.1 nickel ABC transporter, nickel/metallophore periplasmic binding protein [Clostridium aceticum]KJF26918.1 nickel ABC transporter substrate-binding protein [Clostridium aceticum]